VADAVRPLVAPGHAAGAAAAQPRFLRDALAARRATGLRFDLSTLSDGAAAAHRGRWARPTGVVPALDHSSRYGAFIDGKSGPIDRVWTARSLRPVSLAEYAFRIGPLRRWARANLAMPEARPEMPIDLAALPPLF
jgi:hypothetical protein